MRLWWWMHGKNSRHTHRKKLFYLNFQKIKKNLKLANFGVRGRFSQFWCCGSKIFKKCSNLKMVKNHHFSTFVVFFVAFWAKWAKLPTFTQFYFPEISRVLGGTPWKLGFWLQMHWLQLKQLSRNFCRGSEISAKIETFKSALKHISVP